MLSTRERHLMTGAPLFIGADFGTQGVRVGIVDPAGGLAAVADRPYETFFPEPGFCEQNPEDWWRSFNQALAEALDGLGPEQKRAIRGMTVCATSTTALPIDGRGDPLGRALMWMDMRSAGEADAINATGREELDYCGGEVSSEWLIAKAMWYKRRAKDVYAKTFKIVEQLYWINFKLTGELAASMCNATCKCNYIRQRGGFVPEYFNAIGFSDYRDKLVTDVLPVGGAVGVLSPDIAAVFGLPDGVMVYQGGIDAHIAMLGLGANRPGILSITMGTSFVHLTLSEKAEFLRGIWGPYEDATAPGYWLLECGQISAGAVAKWFLNLLFPDGNPEGVAALRREAALVPPGSDGLLALDFFQGNRTPYKDPYTRGAITGLSLGHARGAVYRSLLESVAMGTKNIVNGLKEAGNSFDYIVASGGVLKDSLWMRIISDAADLPVRVVSTSGNGGIFGCAQLASVSSGLYPDLASASAAMVREVELIEPRSDNARVYDELFARYLGLYGSLKASAPL